MVRVGILRIGRLDEVVALSGQDALRPREKRLDLFRGGLEEPAVVAQADCVDVDEVLPGPVKPRQLAVIGVLRTDVLARVVRGKTNRRLAGGANMHGDERLSAWRSELLMRCDDDFDNHADRNSSSPPRYCSRLIPSDRGPSDRIGHRRTRRPDFPLPTSAGLQRS